MTTLGMGENSYGNMMTPQMIKNAAALMTRADPEAGGGMTMTQAFPEGGSSIGGIGNINTMVVGEQGGSILNPGGGGGNFNPPNMATLAIPENGGFGPVTMAVGEDGGGFPPHNAIQMPKLPGGMPPAVTTMAVGEDGSGIGGGMPSGTKMLGEHGRPPQNITTQAVYENGRPPQNIATQVVFENGRPPQMPITQVAGEEGAIGSPSIPGQNPFDFSTFKSDLLTGIGDLFKKYFDETSSPFGSNEITPPPAPGEKKPAMSPGDLVAPSSNYGSLAFKGMQSPFRGL
jgi:hypothetical protein